MTLEQKLLEAKENRHSQIIKVILGFMAVSLLCAVVIITMSITPINKTDSTDNTTEIAQNSITVNPAQSPTIPDDQLRQAYIDVLSHYENTLKPELNKINLNKWDQGRYQHLALLENESLSKFSIADYTGAVNSIDVLNQLAQTIITDSRQEFGQALSSAQNAYDSDRYDAAIFQITTALMLDTTSVEAETLLTKIEQLPEILTLIEQINTAKVENKPEQELSLLKQLIKLVPERESAIDRKQVLVDTINNKNFTSNIAQAYQAIKQADAKQAKQKILAAKTIFPNRPEVTDALIALQTLETKQRLKTYQHAAKTAMATDNWVKAKAQLKLALRIRSNDKALLKSLSKTTAIISLNKEFEQQLSNPYRLSNKQLASRMKNKITQASTYLDSSPSLNKNSNDLSHLIKSMNKKISVLISSDNHTNILVRGVGIVGVTQLKTIQLTPGRYTFEGKRKGFKSKLIDVLVPYNQTSYRLNIRCDEPI